MSPGALTKEIPVPTPSELFAENPVAFCQENVVVVTHQGPGGDQPFKLKLSTRMTAKTFLGSKVDVYEVRREDGGDSFRAYWLPYSDNEKHQIKLRDDGPSIMLTPTMDGCTFAVGGHSTKSKTVVAHLNYQTAPDLGTAVSTLAITRSPPSRLSSSPRRRCSGSGMSAKGAPFRSAPGLRSISEM